MDNGSHKLLPITAFCIIGFTLQLLLHKASCHTIH